MKTLLLILACVLSISAQAQNYSVDKEYIYETKRGTKYFTAELFENHEFYIGKYVCTFDYTPIKVQLLTIGTDEFISNIEFDGDDCVFIAYKYYQKPLPGTTIYLEWEKLWQNH
jgi:hypothetical protein